MFIKQFDHPYLKRIQNLDIHNENAKQALIEKLTFQTIKKRGFTHFLLILFTFGCHYLKLRIDVIQSIEEALSVRKLNALLLFKKMRALKECPSLKKIYLQEELNYLRAHPISEQQLLKVLYFHRPPLKYKKIWQSLFHASSPSLHDVDMINTYYNQLVNHYALPHGEIVSQLRNKMQGQCFSSLSMQELQRAFRELINSQKAS